MSRLKSMVLASAAALALAGAWIGHASAASIIYVFSGVGSADIVDDKGDTKTKTTSADFMIVKTVDASGPSLKRVISGGFTGIELTGLGGLTLGTDGPVPIEFGPDD